VKNGARRRGRERALKRPGREKIGARDRGTRKESSRPVKRKKKAIPAANGGVDDVKGRGTTVTSKEVGRRNVGISHRRGEMAARPGR